MLKEEMKQKIGKDWEYIKKVGKSSRDLSICLWTVESAALKIEQNKRALGTDQVYIEDIPKRVFKLIPDDVKRDKRFYEGFFRIAYSSFTKIVEPFAKNIKIRELFTDNEWKDFSENTVVRHPYVYLSTYIRLFKFPLPEDRTSRYHLLSDLLCKPNDSEAAALNRKFYMNMEDINLSEYIAWEDADVLIKEYFSADKNNHGEKRDYRERRFTADPYRWIFKRYGKSEEFYLEYMYELFMKSAEFISIISDFNARVYKSFTPEQKYNFLLKYLRAYIDLGHHSRIRDLETYVYSLHLEELTNPQLNGLKELIKEYWETCRSLSSKGSVSGSLFRHLPEDISMENLIYFKKEIGQVQGRNFLVFDDIPQHNVMGFLLTTCIHTMGSPEHKIDHKILYFNTKELFSFIYQIFISQVCMLDNHPHELSEYRRKLENWHFITVPEDSITFEIKFNFDPNSQDKEMERAISMTKNVLVEHKRILEEYMIRKIDFNYDTFTIIFDIEAMDHLGISEVTS